MADKSDKGTSAAISPPFKFCVRQMHKISLYIQYNTLVCTCKCTMYYTQKFHRLYGLPLHIMAMSLTGSMQLDGDKCKGLLDLS